MTLSTMSGNLASSAIYNVNPLTLPLSALKPSDMKASLLDRIASAESYMDFVKSTYGTNGDLDAERDAELDMTMARADIEKARELLDVMERVVSS